MPEMQVASAATERRVGARPIGGCTYKSKPHMHGSQKASLTGARPLPQPSTLDMHGSAASEGQQPNQMPAVVGRWI